MKRNLLNLLDSDCGIDYTEIKRTDEKGNDTSICTDRYIQRDFSDAELRLLIDSLLFSKNIPYKQCMDLIEKLKKLSNVYFDKKVAHICSRPLNQPSNKELFFAVDTLDESISQDKKASFTYNSYGTDKKLHPKRKEKYIVNPYQMAAANGRYYLICSYDKYDNLSNYRIYRITDIKILDEKRRPIEATAEGKLNLPKHMAEHIYMFAGESINVRFKAKNYIIDQLADWYGEDITLKPLNGEECEAFVNVNKEAFFCRAMQYGAHIELIEPADIRERIKNTAKSIYEKYAAKTKSGF